jgi:hypothetical protein
MKNIKWKREPPLVDGCRWRVLARANVGSVGSYTPLYENIRIDTCDFAYTPYIGESFWTVGLVLGSWMGFGGFVRGV